MEEQDVDQQNLCLRLSEFSQYHGAGSRTSTGGYATLQGMWCREKIKKELPAEGFEPPFSTSSGGDHMTVVGPTPTQEVLTLPIAANGRGVGVLTTRPHQLLFVGSGIRSTNIQIYHSHHSDAWLLVLRGRDELYQLLE